jgi:aspartate-semialdehyde dehydrogenase
MAKGNQGGGRARAHLALFEANSLSAKSVKDQLVARSFPTASVHLYSYATDSESNLTDFGGEAMLVTVPDLDALGKLDIAFLCGTREEGERYLEWADRADCVAIDLSGASSRSDSVPLINVSVNPGSIPSRSGIVANPRPIAQFLSSLLAPIRRGCGLKSATAVIFQPASECGEKGIEELYGQTLGLLNFRDVPNATFGRQLAFNLLPSFLYARAGIPGGASPVALEREVLRIIGGDVRFSLELVLAPVFHCHSALVHVELSPDVSREKLEGVLRSEDGMRVSNADDAVTPVERAGQEGMVVSGIRPSHGDGTYWMWVVTDNLASGSARNAVRIAEAILNERLTARNH